MGDRYTLELNCAHCGWLNRDVWYAESCNATDFKCEGCGEWNDVVMGFHAVKQAKETTP